MYCLLYRTLLQIRSLCHLWLHPEHSVTGDQCVSLNVHKPYCIVTGKVSVTALVDRLDEVSQIVVLKPQGMKQQCSLARQGREASFER